MSKFFNKEIWQDIDVYKQTHFYRMMGFIPVSLSIRTIIEKIFP